MPDTHGSPERGSAPATAAGWRNEKPENVLRDAEQQEAAHERSEALDRPHPILCRCRDCLADDYGYTPSTEPDPSLSDDGAA